MIVGAASANEVLVQAFEGARLKWSAPWTTELKKFLASTAPILFPSVWPKILAVLGRACVLGYWYSIANSVRPGRVILTF